MYNDRWNKDLSISQIKKYTKICISEYLSAYKSECECALKCFIIMAVLNTQKYEMHYSMKMTRLF